MCCGALRAAQIARVVLGARNVGVGRRDAGSYGLERLLDMTRSSIEVVTGVREAECTEMSLRGRHLWPIQPDL